MFGLVVILKAGLVEKSICSNDDGGGVVIIMII